jgi:Zn-dependent protease with chaperone function
VSAPARYFDGRTGTAHEVLADLLNGALTITAADATEAAAGPVASWHAAEVQRCDGDVSGSVVVLRRKGGAERLVLQDSALVAALAEAGAAVSGPTSWGHRRWLALAAGLVASVAVAALLVDRLPGLATPFVPHRLERAWSTQIESVMAVSTTVCDGAAGQAALTKLFARLSAAAGLPAPPDFEVLDGRMVNAFTLPDGRIVVLKGLIDLAQDPNEFAGVLAHELGHVKHRDPTREMLRRVALNMTARSLGWGGGVASTMTALSYGRQAEAAADASAIETLRAAGLRADGLGRFFDFLQTKLGDGGIPAYLSDHPSTAERAARLRQPAVGASALSDGEWSSVRGMCGP